MKNVLYSQCHFRRNCISRGNFRGRKFSRMCEIERDPLYTLSRHPAESVKVDFFIADPIRSNNNYYQPTGKYNNFIIIIFT